MRSVKDFGAKGDGVADDTAAINAALREGRVDTNGNWIDDYLGAYFNGRPSGLYFPAGTYLVSNTLEWSGCCMTLQGQGAGATVIRLKDSATGFQDAAAARPVIRNIIGAGNDSFRQNIFDLMVDTGSRNAGATGISYLSNNVGSIRNLRIRSGDGRGVTGLDMTRPWPGPSMVKNLQVDGFDTGIHVEHYEYAPTLENIVLNDQRVVGLRNGANALSVIGLVSNNAVPAVLNGSYTSEALMTLINAQLNGGGAGVSGIDNRGNFYGRNITAQGYATAVSHDGKPVAGTKVTEWSPQMPERLFTSTESRLSLNLPIAATPDASETDLAQWAGVNCNGYTGCQVASELQSLLDSGKSTIYFPFGNRIVFDELTVTVPPNVKRIIGFNGIVNGDAAGLRGGGIKFVVSDASTTPLVIEQFGYGVKVHHTGKRPVAIRSGFYRYTSSPGAGDLYLEDVGLEPLTVQAGQNVWARQFNNEYGSDRPGEKPGAKITSSGNLWVMGLKTERGNTVIDTRAGGRTELLGGLLLPSRAIAQTDPAFILTDAQASYIVSHNIYCTDCGYGIWVRETRGAESRSLAVPTGRHPRLFFNGF